MALFSKDKKKGLVLIVAYNGVLKACFSLATVISPTLNTKLRYYLAFKKKLNLDDPKTLNEKILWLKLKKYMKDPLIIKCADKYRVRDYVRESGCEDILIPILGAWDSADAIPWEELPNQFVMKWNFGSGMNFVCTDKSKVDKETVIKQFNKWGKNKYWLSHSEMQYKYAPKKIICEQLLSDKEE